MRIPAMIWMAAALMACGEEPYGLNPSGDTIRVTCTADASITYQHTSCDTYEDGVCSSGEDVCLPTTSEFTGSWSYCRAVGKGELDLDPGTFSADLREECQKSCPSEVSDEACDMGRYATNIDSCDLVGATYEMENCSVSAAMEQELELSYSSLMGTHLGAMGKVSYTLEAPGRTGRDGTLWSIELTSALSVSAGPRELTSLMGFEEGTVVEVRETRLLAPVPFTLDARDRATFKADTIHLVVDVDITEPDGPTSRRTLHGTVPLTLTLTATETALSLEAAPDVFGNTFTFLAPRR